MNYKLIQIEKYLLAIEESKVNEGDYGLGFAEGINGIGRGYSLFFHDGSNKAKVNTIAENTYKVVAHLPLNNSPILEGVPLLPPLENEAEKLAEQECIKDEWISEKSFKVGYNKAKEKYKYTEDDIRDAMNFGKFGEFNGIKTTIKFIESLSQPKYPITFEYEMEENKPKTTSNSQELRILVGKYIY